MNLTDRDEIIAKIRKEYDNSNRLPTVYMEGVSDGLLMAQDIAETAQIVDASPVVHGEWETTSYNAYMVRCSKCHCGDHIQLAGKDIFNYCPYCGAKMDGERK